MTKVEAYIAAAAEVVRAAHELKTTVEEISQDIIDCDIGIEAEEIYAGQFFDAIDTESEVLGELGEALRRACEAWVAMAPPDFAALERRRRPRRQACKFADDKLKSMAPMGSA